MRITNLIPVNKAYLPDLELLTPILKEIWKSKILTNEGPLHNKFEKELAQSLSIRRKIGLVTNGTRALELSLKISNLPPGSEVITTPFTWVSTCSSIVWTGLNPVFVDIDVDTFNIDTAKIENAITPKTKAILAVHAFSAPCKIDEIEKIAKKYDLKVIFDAAHCYGVTYQDQSIFNFGDLSTLSLHATKIVHCGEGGAIVGNSKDINLLKKIRHCGLNQDKKIDKVGTNSKLSELHAALGLSIIRDYTKILKKRKDDANIYFTLLENCNAIKFQKFDPRCYNFSYMPIVLEKGISRDKLVNKLLEEGFSSRKYFSPSLNTVDLYSPKNRYNCPVSEEIAKKILCLPSFFELEVKHIESICRIIKKSI